MTYLPSCNNITTTLFSYILKTVVFSSYSGTANMLLHKKNQKMVIAGILLWLDGAYTCIINLRKSNCINLPSQRTLRDYTHFVDSVSGFTDDLDSQLVQDSKLTSLKEHEKYVGLIGDEMHVKQGLVYDKNTWDLIGYCNLGSINNHLTQLEHQYSNNTQSTNLATTIMVLMIRGLFNSFTFPYASFPTSNLAGEQMVPIFYEAIMRIERCGLKVVSITLDGNSVNMKFIKLVGNQATPAKHKFCNPLSENNREVYLFSDPPHLLKTAHNCLSNPNRQMKVNNLCQNIHCIHMSIKISLTENQSLGNYIKQLYEIATKTTGVTTLPKLKYELISIHSQRWESIWQQK